MWLELCGHFRSKLILFLHSCLTSAVYFTSALSSVPATAVLQVDSTEQSGSIGRLSVCTKGVIRETCYCVGTFFLADGFANFSCFDINFPIL